MSALARIKKTAAQHEQERQYDKALALYARLLDGAEAGGEEVDVALFNRAGDLALRLGDAPRAVGYFERALDLYAAAGLLNNAVALGVKILRHAPHHLSAHYTLGVLYGRKGFVGDSRQHLLTYAVQMQRAGRVDETGRVLAEVATTCADTAELRAAQDAFGAMGGDPAHAAALAGGVATAVVEPAAARAAGRAPAPGPEFLDLSTPSRDAAPAAPAGAGAAAAPAGADAPHPAVASLPAAGFDFLDAVPAGLGDPDAAGAAPDAVLFDALPERADAVDLDLLPATVGGPADLEDETDDGTGPLVFLESAAAPRGAGTAPERSDRLDALANEPPPLRLAELADVAAGPIAEPAWTTPAPAEAAPFRFADLAAVELDGFVAAPAAPAATPGDGRPSAAADAAASPRSRRRTASTSAPGCARPPPRRRPA
jgi:hypothetical protein